MKLIVGLGNPGNEYDDTRHNTGFMALDNYCKKNFIDINKQKFDGLYGEKVINNEKVIFLKPQSYMNLSGNVIYKYAEYFKIPIENILIIHDDMDLEVGIFKIRYKGGSAGHNGLKNIEANFKTNEYKRIKIGISKNKDINIVDYVLGKFSKADLEKMSDLFLIINNVLDDYFNLTFENLMNKYN